VLPWVGVEYWFWPSPQLPPAGAKPHPGIQLPNPLKERRAATRSFWGSPATSPLLFALLGIVACKSNSGPPPSAGGAQEAGARSCDFAALIR